MVTERLQHAGERVRTGETARANLRLAQTHPLRVEVVLPVAMYGKLAGHAAFIIARRSCGPVSGHGPSPHWR